MEFPSRIALSRAIVLQRQPWLKPNDVNVNPMDANRLLSSGMVEVWSFSLKATNSDLNRWHPMLSTPEKARAQQFLFPAHRDRFITGRAGLRMLLSDYLHRPAKDIALSYTTEGKPFLADTPWLQFNLSHSEDFAMVAISRECEVGIDVELMREDIDMENIAVALFSAPELLAWKGLSTPKRSPAFYKAWVCKEAWVKALGCGLSCPFNTLVLNERDGDLSISPERRPQMIYRLTAPAQFAAALVVAGNGMTVRQHAFNPAAREF